MPPLRMSSEGGCCGIAYDSSVSLIQVNGEGFVHRIVGVPGMSDHAMSAIVVSKWAGTGSDSCYDYPKIPLGHLCETNYASLTKYRLIRPSNVNGTGAQPTTKSSSYSIPVWSAMELSGELNLLELVPRIQYFSIMSDVV